MKILSISALFPPEVLGGAEMSAFNLASWLHGQGHEVFVLSTAATAAGVTRDAEMNGLKISRRYMRRPYPIYRFPDAPAWKKPLWHLQDHFDPNNRRQAAEVLDRVRPDVIALHFLQGIGYNVLREIAEREIPVVYFLHDLGLACIKMSMFREGKECEKQCALCKVSCSYKQALVAKIPRIGFCSPSRANLAKLAKFFPMQRYPHTSILNTNRYPPPTVPRTESPHLRLIYVGRLHATKGVGLLLEAARRVHRKHGDERRFELTIVGNGPEEGALKSEYGSETWCKFTGFLSQKEISNLMMASDLACVPSIWFENSPGVLIHGLGLGLPALASDIGGIPELLEHERNGLLVPPGDLDAWAHALEGVLLSRERLTQWRSHALAHAYRFDQDYLGQRTLRFFESVIHQTTFDPA
jgi:glycosyltransferase involved in cell wall biosynthesis